MQCPSTIKTQVHVERAIFPKPRSVLFFSPPSSLQPRRCLFALLQVLGLTLPTLNMPTVTACERTACTVEWTSSFIKQGQDQTKLGFNLSFVPAAATNASTTGGGGERGGGFMEVIDQRNVLTAVVHVCIARLQHSLITSININSSSFGGKLLRMKLNGIETT